LATGVDETVLATALVVVIFEEMLGMWKGSWELVVEKARKWLESEVGLDGVDGVVERAREVIGI
jgi:hypothetical protein